MFYAQSGRHVKARFRKDRAGINFPIPSAPMPDSFQPDGRHRKLRAANRLLAPGANFCEVDVVRLLAIRVGGWATASGSICLPTIPATRIVSVIVD